MTSGSATDQMAMEVRLAGTPWGSHRVRDKFSSPTPVVPARVLSIGVLRGTWSEMGRQYGERAATDIAEHWDVDWADRVLNSTAVWAVSRGAEGRSRYRLQYLQRSWNELEEFSPEICEFMTGVAEGAGPALSGAHVGREIPHHLKVLYLNESDSALHPNWDFAADAPGESVGMVDGASDFVSDHDNMGDGCNGFWLSGEGTSSGHALAQRAVQAGLNRSLTAVSYVAVPSDPKAQVYWGLGRAGCLGGLGAMMNAAGVCVMSSGSQGGDVDETLAPGVKDFILGAYGVMFCDTAQSAAAAACEGPEEYRSRTGRKTVRRFRGANLLFGDPVQGVAVESNARWYWQRTAGSGSSPSQRDDPGYVVIANHFVADASRDELNEIDNRTAMSAFVPGRSGSLTRYWTGYWWLKNRFGGVTVADVKEFAGSHGVYDPDGTFWDVDPDSGRQTSRDETWCAHRWPADGEPVGLGEDGNSMTTVFDLTSREVWFVPVWPCHHRNWGLEWNYLNLMDYVGEPTRAGSM